jgi:hypothetical protein
MNTKEDLELLKQYLEHHKIWGTTSSSLDKIWGTSSPGASTSINSGYTSFSPCTWTYQSQPTISIPFESVSATLSKYRVPEFEKKSFMQWAFGGDQNDIYSCSKNWNLLHPDLFMWEYTFDEWQKDGISQFVDQAVRHYLMISMLIGI